MVGAVDLSRLSLCLYCVVHPPSTISELPVTMLEASDARNTIGPINSCAVPKRPSGVALEIAFLRCSPAGADAN